MLDASRALHVIFRSPILDAFLPGIELRILLWVFGDSAAWIVLVQPIENIVGAENIPLFLVCSTRTAVAAWNAIFVFLYFANQGVFLFSIYCTVENWFSGFFDWCVWKFFNGGIGQSFVHEVAPDWSSSEDSVRSLGHRRIVVVSRPDAGNEARGVADRPGVSPLVCRSGFRGDRSVVKAKRRI